MALPPWLSDVIKPIDPGPVITGALSLAAGTLGTVLTFWVSKKKAKGDVQATLNASFQLFTNELQEERIEARAQIREQANQIREQANQLSEALYRIRKLEDALHAQGLPIPV